MKRDRVAEIALRKLRKFCNRQWVACLTPAECVYLLDKGCKLSLSSNYSETSMRELLSAGRSGMRWCYFRSIKVIPPNDLPFK